MKIFKIILIGSLLASLTGCAGWHRATTVTTYQRTSANTYERRTVSYVSWDDQSYLQQGKRYFEAGYYKSAMRTLLPLACDGVPEAQYAVGYMYYYGYGVSQDTEVGYFWIQRAAANGFPAAIQALALISRDKDSEIRFQEKWRGKQNLDD